MLPYGEEWRKYRKVLHSGLHARRAESYKDMQSLEGKATLRDILLHPEAWDANIQRCVWQSFGEEPQNKRQPFSDMRQALLYHYHMASEYIAWTSGLSKRMLQQWIVRYHVTLNRSVLLTTTVLDLTRYVGCPFPPNLSETQ